MARLTVVRTTPFEQTTGFVCRLHKKALPDYSTMIDGREMPGKWPLRKPRKTSSFYIPLAAEGKGSDAICQI